MPTSDPTEILIAHDHWANQQVLNACVPLSSEQFHQRFDMGPGSLHDTMTHVMGAMRAWTDTLAGREHRPRPEGTARTIAELQAMLEESAADFAAHAKAHPHDELVTRIREGKTYTFTRGAIITHVATHGMHHRAQCLNMLRHLGVQTQPLSSVTQWTMAGDPLR